MTKSIHPALSMPFEKLYSGLEMAVAEGLVNKKTHGCLALYCYSKECVFSKSWNPITKLARGIILCPETREIIALPFPKFFNYGEETDEFPDLPFDTFEKLDGSLIILYSWANRWYTATKGSFTSSQAESASKFFGLGGIDVSKLNPEVSYLLEYVGPDNKIVIQYPQNELKILGAYDRGTGEEISWDSLTYLAKEVGFGVPHKYSQTQVSELLEKAKTIPSSEEGWVLRFENGYRLKIKGDEYRRIHAALSHLTPLSIWRIYEAGGDDALNQFALDLPDEFHQDFKSIRYLLKNSLDFLIESIRNMVKSYAEYSDKDLGLILHTLPAPMNRFVFFWRKRGEESCLNNPTTRHYIFQEFRPSGNRLPGYMPSYGLSMILNDHES